jgi:hypothetical protein
MKNYLQVMYDNINSMLKHLQADKSKSDIVEYVKALEETCTELLKQQTNDLELHKS